MMRPGVDAGVNTGVLSVALLNDKLNSVLSVDSAKHQMRVGPGMDMGRLFKAATANEMSVQLMTLPFYSGLTLGGILATASHGTGDRTASALVDMVTEATWVDASGEVHVASRDTPETWAAINGGLGLLGVITELNLQLTPPTNTRLETHLNQPDTNIFGDIERLLKVRVGVGVLAVGSVCELAVFVCALNAAPRPLASPLCSARKHQPRPTATTNTSPTHTSSLNPKHKHNTKQITPHILIFWRPDMGRYSAFMTSIAPPDAKPDHNVTMELLPDMTHQPNMAGGFKAWQEDIYDADPMRSLMCFYPPPVSIVQQLTVHRAWARAGGRFGEPRFNVTAPTNQMQATECDQNCLWNGPQFKGTAQDAEFAIDWDAFAPWIDDVKAIFHKDLFRNGTRPDRCQGAGYLWLRFGKGSDDYLSMTTGLKRPVYLQSTWLRNTEAWQYPLRYGYVPELIELMTLCKYQARPHFGKNWDRTFTHAACPVRPRYARFDELLALQAKVDPQKVFEPPLFSKVVSGEAYKPAKDCVRNYECFCSADEHCPEEFKCVPSLALPQFKVCKPPADWDPARVKAAATDVMKVRLAGTQAVVGGMHSLFGERFMSRVYAISNWVNGGRRRRMA